jgi:hypothetical protein
MRRLTRGPHKSTWGTLANLKRHSVRDAIGLGTSDMTAIVSREVAATPFRAPWGRGVKRAGRDGEGDSVLPA